MRRVRESGEYREEVREIRAEAERLRHEQNPELAYSLFAVFAQRGTRLEYERVYFERRRRLNTFALLALLDPDDQVAEHELLDMIWSVCGEYTWCLPAHLGADGHERAIDLFAAETGFTLGEIALLLQGRLPRLLQTRIEAEVNRRLFEPFLRNGPYEWETARHNWAAVCAGSSAPPRCCSCGTRRPCAPSCSACMPASNATCKASARTEPARKGPGIGTTGSAILCILPICSRGAR
ncbi:hypothetical protein HMSSN036_85930 [Paenibacillus macerans]|nr:hypothetical protein HMSSN036_85930 [Paenibacillus macerans]